MLCFLPHLANRVKYYIYYGIIYLCVYVRVIVPAIGNFGIGNFGLAQMLIARSDARAMTAVLGERRRVPIRGSTRDESDEDEATWFPR